MACTGTKIMRDLNCTSMTKREFANRGTGSYTSLLTCLTVALEYRVMEAGRSIMMVTGLSSEKGRGSITVSTS
jgi:hypothetical protein